MIVYGERLLPARAAPRRPARCSTSPRGSGSPAAPAPACSRRPRRTNARGAARGRLRARPRPRLRDARRAGPIARHRRRARRRPALDACGCTTPTRCARSRTAPRGRPRSSAAQTVIAVDSVLTDTIREHADVVFPAEAYAEKEGTLTHPGRARAAPAPRDRPAQGARRAERLRRAPAVAGDRRRRRAHRAGPRDPHRPDGLAAALRRRAVLRRADARRDRRPRHPLAHHRGRRGLRGRDVGARQARRPRRRAGRLRGRAAPRHLPHAVGLQGGRRLAVAGASCARARSSSSRPPTPSGSGSARATRSRSAPTGRA